MHVKCNAHDFTSNTCTIIHLQSELSQIKVIHIITIKVKMVESKPKYIGLCTFNIIPHAV